MKQTTPLSVLAIGAHPDDVEIYCLGLLLRLKAMGWRIGWIVATDGQAGLSENGALDERRIELERAGQSVGVAPICLSLMDGELTDTPAIQISLRSAIANFAPNLIVTHHPQDYHPDHRALSHLVRGACGTKTGLAYFDTMLGLGCLPDFSIDISDVADDKHKALSQHQSQKPELFLPSLVIWEKFRAIQTINPRVLCAEAYCFPDLYQKRKVQRLLKEVIV